MKNDRNKPRVVLDTNVWLSGIVFGGTPARLIRLFARKNVEVVISEQLMAELKRVITQKFPTHISDLDPVEQSLHKDAEWVGLGGRTAKVSRDPDDDMVIETAILGKCQYIISGDQDLLSLGEYDNILIVTPSEFLDLVV